MSKKSQKPQPSPAEASAPEEPAKGRRTIHLGLAPKQLAQLDKILGRMRDDDYLDAMQLDLGREKAARYAIAFCAKHMPERITATG